MISFCMHNYNVTKICANNNKQKCTRFLVFQSTAGLRVKIRCFFVVQTKQATTYFSHPKLYYIVFSLCCCPVSKYHYTTTTYIYCNKNSNKKEEMSRENPRRRNRRREVQRRVCENSGIFFPSVMYYVRP